MKSREFLAYEESRSYHFRYNCCDISENDPREGLSVVIYIVELTNTEYPSYRYRWNVEFPVKKDRWFKQGTHFGVAANYAQAVDDIHWLLRDKGISPMPNEHNRRTL